MTLPKHTDASMGLFQETNPHSKFKWYCQTVNSTERYSNAMKDDKIDYFQYFQRI